MRTFLLALLAAVPVLAQAAATDEAPAAPQAMETREISPAKTPLTGQALALWQSNIWVTANVGFFMQDNLDAVNGEPEMLQAVEGKKDGLYYWFASYRPGDDGKRNVALWVSRCELGAVMGDKCTDPGLKGYTATDDGRLLAAWQSAADGGKNLRTDPNIESDFSALRTLWLTQYTELYSATMDQGQLNKIFQCDGCVKPKNQN